MKFENIKVGDTVIDREIVRVTWGVTEAFFIRKTVKSVSPKQFVLEDGTRCKKEDGRIIGDYGYVYIVGDKYNRNKLVTDQTEEMEEFKQLLSRKIKLRDEYDNLKSDFIRLDLTVDEVNTLEELITSLKSILNKND